jgi:hypothetical protein
VSVFLFLRLENEYIMMVFRNLFTACLGTLLALGASAQNVVEDDGIGISYDELEYLVSNWPAHMQEAAANDDGDRLELLNMVMVVKKLAREADKIEPGTDTYYRYNLKIDSEKRKFMLEEFARSLDVPDMTALAKERYETHKDQYALVPEQRTSSHILVSCPTGSKCSRPEAQAKAQEILDQLRDGADFVEMVELHSGDPGSKDKGGKFDRWVMLGDSGVSPPYAKALFEIEEEGGYSEIVNTQFGVHIIRLDEVRESYYLPFKQVEAKIVADLEAEYRKLAMKDYRARYNLSDEAYINGDAMEAIFSKYRTAN